jgi:hypothetical protein
VKRIAVCTVLLLAVLAPAAQAARTSIRFRALDTSIGPAVTDTRYAAYPIDSDTVRVVDALTGGRLDIDHPASCQLAALGGGQVLWNCDKPLATARLVDIETGLVRQPQFDPATDTARSFDRIGTRWIAGTATGDGYTNNDFYVNWRTGERRRSSALGARSYASLGSASLARPLCSPLRRPRSGSFDPDHPELFGDPFDDYEYQRPLGMRTFFDGERFSLLLDRCGRRTTQTVTRRPFASEQLLAGKVTYAKPGAVYAYLPQSGRRFKWAVRDIYRSGERSADVRHTAERIFASVPELEGSAVWHISVARWPR